MRVLSYSPYDDTGGLGWNLASAFNTFRPSWTYESFVGAPSYLHFPIHTPWSWPAIKAKWAEADVVHLHDGFHAIDGFKPKPKVVTWHGVGFRAASDYFIEQQLAQRAVGLVSTLDLYLKAPEDVTWCPAPFDVPWLHALRVNAAPRDKTPLRIGHAPTNRSLKSTDALIAAVKRLKQTEDVELVIVEGASWMDALNAKVTFDIYFDQTLYGYGGNSIEAFSMAIPVIAGAEGDTLAEMVRRFDGGLPFKLCDEGTIYEALTELLDPEARKVWGARGLRHAVRYHHQSAACDLLEPLYAEAIARF